MLNCICFLEAVLFLHIRLSSFSVIILGTLLPALSFFFLFFCPHWIDIDGSMCFPSHMC